MKIEILGEETNYIKNIYFNLKLKKEVYEGMLTERSDEFGVDHTVSWFNKVPQNIEEAELIEEILELVE